MKVFFILKRRIRRFLHIKRRRYYMKKYGTIALSYIHDVSKEQGKPIWLAYGTLLGAYRDKGFIKHDDDIDMAMYAKDFDHQILRRLFDKGFTVIRQFSKITQEKPDEAVVTEITLLYKGLQIDIFFIFDEPDGQYSYICGGGMPNINMWQALPVVYSFTGKFKEINFEGTTSYVPVDAKEFLEHHYGEHFMIPDKKYTRSKDQFLPLEKCHWEMFGAWH